MHSRAVYGKVVVTPRHACMLPADTYAHWAAQLFRTGTPSPAVVDAIIGDYASQLRAATKTAVQDHELLHATQLLTRAQPYAAGTRTTLTAAVTQVGSVYHCYGVPSVLDGNRSAARLLWISDRQNHGAPLDTDTVHTSAPAAWDNPVIRIALPGKDPVYTTLQHVAPQGYPCRVELEEMETTASSTALASMPDDGGGQPEPPVHTLDVSSLPMPVALVVMVQHGVQTAKLAPPAATLRAVWTIARQGL